jgi:AAA domain
MDKLRCQTPFRASSSYAAFIARDSRGNPFIHDVGTNTTHRLVDATFEEFEPCDYEIIEGEAAPTMPPNPFEKFSLLGKSCQIEKKVVGEQMLLGNLAVLGQLTVFYADPNTGKTLIVIYLLTVAIRAHRVKAKQVFYINVDDNLNGLLQKLRIAEEYGFHMVADGHEGFKVSVFVATLMEIIEQGQAHGVVIILDTLKKFANLMDKAHSTNFNKLLRRFAMCGGTVIALAHTNKKRDSDGKPIYAGTSDVLEDFDCGYLMMERKGAESAGQKVIVFENIKRRGNVVLTTAYAYSTEPDQSYDQLLASVQEIGEIDFLSLHASSNSKCDFE